MAEEKSPSIGEDTGRDKKSGRFTKGNKQGGRKAWPTEMKEMMKAATPAAAKLMIDTMNDPSARLDIRIDCATKIIERVYGRPTQPIDGDIDAKVVFMLSEELTEYAQ